MVAAINFVKSGVASNGIISYLRISFSFLICFRNVFVLLMVYSEGSNGDNNFGKDFVVWYVTALVFNTIGQSGKPSTLLVESLCISAVP